MEVDRFVEDYPAWVTAVGTAIGWGLVLFVVLVVFFVLPLLVWP